MKKIVALLNILLVVLMASAALADSTISGLGSGGAIQTQDFVPVYRPSNPGTNFKVQLGSAASQSIGTSGATLGLLNTANTYGALQAFPSGDLTAADPVFTGSSVTLPSGTTGARPGSPANGMIRYNTSLTALEAYVNGAWGPLGSGSGITALTGDGTASGTGSVPFTLATVNSTAGSYGDASHVATFTVNGKGLVTVSGIASITPAAIGAPTTTGTGASGTWGIGITGNAANITGIAAIANGGTGQATQQAALNALAGATTSGLFLRGNGTNVVLSAIQAADVPTLNQNTTGNAATVTTNANLIGDVTSSGNATTLTNAPVIAKVLTGFTAAAGTVSATDSILSAFQKVVGNINALTTGVSSVFGRSGAVVATSGDYSVGQVTGAAPLASPTFTGTVTLPAGQVVNGVTLNSAGSSSLFLNQAGAYSTPSGSGGLTVASTTITSGVTTKVLFDNAGILGEYTVSGSGNVCMTTSCVLVGPALGTPVSGVLTNATGLPISTGVSGLGTGVATLLGGASSGTGGPAGTASPTFTGTVGGSAATWSGVDTALNFTATGTGADTLPVGITSQRPGSPSTGMVRYNSTTNVVEAYINSAWTPLSNVSPPVIYTANHTVAASEVNGLNISQTNPVTFSLAQAGTAGFVQGTIFNFLNGGSIPTITPTTSTFYGFPATVLPTLGGWLSAFSDGTNYATIGSYGVSASDGLTAAGTNRATCLQLTAETNNITSAAASTGVCLPMAEPDERVIVANNGANAVQVYGLNSDTINGTAGSTGVSLAAGTSVIYTAPAAAKWLSLTGGSMTFPGAGIANSTGSGWGTSYSVSGTGNVCLTTNCALVTPNLGTPSAVNLTNATALPTSALPSNQTIRSIVIVIDGGGSAITTGVKGTLVVPFACTINSSTLLADQTGSIVVDVWKKAFAGTLPTVANTITASALPTLSSAITVQDTTLTGWTTSVSANDMITYNVNSATTVTRVTLVLKCTAT